ncbi:MAG: hypothetical protein IKJ12_06735 [Rikenellaceae bacterium]|nr:hypothetical protein [Rikenellaceae bacterium]
MKNFLLKVALIGAMFAGLALTGCENEDPMENVAMGAEVTSTSLTGVSVKVMTNGITEYAYTVMQAGATKPTADAVFANGTVKSLEFTDGEDAFTVSGLTPESDYVCYVAGKAGSTYYPVVCDLAFSTAVVPASMTAALVESATTAQTLSVEVKTVKIKAFAYTAFKAEEAPEKAPNADVVFADGQMVECSDGTHSFTLEELSPNTEYVVYVAGLLSEADENGNNQPYEKVLEVKATTGDFTEELTIFDNTGRSFKLHVKPTLSDPANVIKWGTCDIFMYNMNNTPDFEMLNLHDQYYGNYFQGDTTLVFDEAHGNVWSDEMGDYITYYEAIVPGQPQYLALGEFKYEEDEDVHGRWGWGAGYYLALMDQEGYMNAMMDSWYGGGEMPNENDYWTGYHKQIKFQTKAPELLDADLEIDMSGLRANGGPIKINTNGNADRITVMLLDPMTYQQIMPFLDDNEDYLQWFTTSYVGFMMVGSKTLGGANIKFEMTDFLWEVNKEETYKLLVVATKDAVEGSLDAKYQQFAKADVVLPDYKLPAPTLEITPIESTSPFEVSFNVKCPSQDAYYGKYAANYAREWAEAGFDENPAEAMEYNGNDLTADDLALINSAEGMVFSFPSYEDMVTKLGVVLESIEGLPCEPVIVENKSLAEPAKTPVDSKYFTSLDGDWTATATNRIVKQTYDWQNGTYIYDTLITEKVSKVTIGDVTYPASLDEEVYNTWFENTPYKTEAEVDAQFALFKEAVDIFNKKNAAQNRILMNGFDFQVPLTQYYTIYSKYSSPFELWCSDSYNGYDNTSPVWDFGPKWYLEVAQDGTVTAPFNMNYFAPMSNWSSYNAYYFAGASDKAYMPYNTAVQAEYPCENGQFPVEISEDGNTITVKPLVAHDDTFYPNMGYVSWGNFTMGNYGQIVSEIVLTRGWTEEGTDEPDETTAVANGVKYVPANYTNLYNVKPAQKPMPRTVIKAMPNYEKVEMKVVSVDEFKANVEKLRKATKAAARK